MPSFMDFCGRDLVYIQYYTVSYCAHLSLVSSGGSCFHVTRVDSEKS